MTLEQLRIFVAVAERQHVTAAARALNLTQSAVSNAIAALEQHHGLRLFDRVGRGIELNGTGRVFLPEARAVLARAAAAEAVLQDFGSPTRGRLAVFASQTIASYWLPERLVRFQAQHPGITLDVAAGNTSEAADAVLAGLAELGLVEGAVQNPLLERTPVGRDRLAVLVPPAHRWAGLEHLTATDLFATPWVLRERGSGTRSSLEQALLAAGCDPAALPVALTLPSNEAVLAAALAGAGAAALSEHVAQNALAAGRLVRAPYQLPERHFVLLRHRDRYRTKTADAFARSLALQSCSA